MAHVIRQFPKETLKALLCGKLPGYEVLENEPIGHSRWSVQYQMVFSFEGKTYISHYSIGATEYQMEEPYEYDKEMVNCYEAIRVLTPTWVAAEATP